MNKKSNKMMLMLSVICVFLLVMGAASAADDDLNQTIGDSVSDEVITLQGSVEEDTVSTGTADEILAGDGSNSGSFTELNRIIKFSREGQTIKLNKNYTCDDEIDFRLTDGIIIDHELTIDGQGYTLNGNNISRIFKITGNNVVLKNINFINARVSLGTGGAIFISGADAQIMKCNFTDNYAKQGGAIAPRGGNVFISDSIFTGNDVNFVGGALYSTSGTIENCKFYSNGGGNNGVIFVDGNGLNILNCEFENQGSKGICFYSNFNLVENCIFNGSSLMTPSSSANNIIRNSYFINCTNTLSIASSNLIDNCTFNDNKNTVIELNGNSNIIQNSKFINNPNTVIKSDYSFGNINNTGLNESNLELSEGVLFLDYNDFYVKVNGTGKGTKEDPTNFTYALNNILMGKTIYLEPGVYTDIRGLNINKMINICGLGEEVIIDLNNNGFAFVFNAPDVLVDNIIVKNGFTDTSYGVITFNNRGKLTNSQFINNTGSIVNVKHNLDLYLENNTFIGSYIRIAPMLTSAYPYANLKMSRSNGLTAKIIIDGEEFLSTGDTSIDLTGLSTGSHIMEVIFDAGNGNQYINTENKTFTIQDDVIIYTSPEGAGNMNGSSQDNAVPYKLLSDYLADSVQIILSPGTYDTKLIIDKSYVNITSINKDAILNNSRIIVNGRNVSISNIKFQNAYYSDNTYGGAIYWTGSNGILKNSTFENLVAKRGGAVYWAGLNGILTECNFTNCNSTAYGGAVYWDGGIGVINNSEFTSCNVVSGEGMGGAIYIIDATVYNSTFKKCNLVGKYKQGSAIFANYGNIQYCEFVGNSGGGVIQSNGAEINNCIFENNVTSISGRSTVKNTIIKNLNHTGQVLSMSNSLIDNCSFTNSNTSNSAIISGSNNNILNCNFTNVRNINGVGGAISGNNNNIMYCNFDNCSSGNNGGAIYGSGNIKYCNFINCYASVGNYILYLTDSSIISNCNFSSGVSVNTIKRGILLTSNVIIKNCYFNKTCVYDDGVAVVNSSVVGNIFIDSIVKLSGQTSFYMNYIKSETKVFGNHVYDNYFGKNNITADEVKNLIGLVSSHVDVNWKAVYTNLVDGAWNGAIQVYFTSNQTGTNYTHILDLPVEVTVNINNTEIKDQSTRYNIKILPSGNEEIKVTGKINNIDLDELSFNKVETATFSDLQNLINGYTDGETIVLNNNFTYNPETDSDLINGVVISNGVTIDFNNTVIDGNNQAKIFNISSDNVGLENVIIKNSKDPISWTGDNAVITNLQAENVSGTVIDMTGDNAAINNVDLSGLKDITGIKVNGDSTTINDITAKDASGSLLDINGSDATVSSVDLNNFNGTAITTNGYNTNINDVSVVGGEGMVINASGDRANIDGLNLTDFTGTGVNIIGNNSDIGSVNVTGGKSTVVNVTGNNAVIGGVDLTNHTGTGLHVEGNDSTFSGVSATGGNSTVMEVSGEGLSVSGVDLTNHTGTGIKTDGLAKIETVTVEGGSGNAIESTGDGVQVNGITVNDFNGTAVTVSGDNTYIDNINADGVDNAIVVSGEGTNIATVTLNNVTNGIKVNSTGEANIKNVNTENVVNPVNVTAKGDVNIDTVTVKNSTGDSAINVESDGDVDINGVNADDVVNGAAINATGKNVNVSNTDLNNVKDGVKANASSGSATLNNVDVSNAEGKAIDASATENIDISGSDLNNVGEGISAKSESGNVTVDDVTADGVHNGAAVDATGDNVGVSNTNLTNVKDGVRVDAKENATVSEVKVDGGNGTAVDIDANNADVENITLENTNGTGVKTNATSGSVKDVEVNGGNITDAIDSPNTENDKVNYEPTIKRPDIIYYNDDFTITVTISDPEAKLEIYYDNVLVGDGTNMVINMVATLGEHNITVVYNNKQFNDSFSVRKYTFKDLQDDIDAAIENNESSFTIVHDVFYEDGEETLNIVADDFTIEGNGHTIDANNQSSILNVSGNNIVIKDMDLTGAKDGAIVANGSGIVIEDVSVSNSTGTAISLTGENSTIKDVTLEHVDNGISVDGTGKVDISGVTVGDATGKAIDVVADNISIENTNLTQVSEGIIVNASEVVLETVKVDNVDNGDAINVQADKAEISSVNVSDVKSGNAVTVKAENVTVSGENSISGVEGTAMDITAENNVEITGKNTIENVAAAVDVKADTVEITGENTIKDVNDAVKVNATGDVKVSGVSVANATGKSVDVETENGNVEVGQISLEDVNDGINVEAESGKATVKDINVENSNGTAVNVKADEVVISGENSISNATAGMDIDAGKVNITGETTIKDVADAVIVDAAGDVSVSGLDVTNATGKAVDVKTESGNVEVTDIKLDDVGEGISAKTESGNVAVDDVVASDVHNGAAIDATGDNVNIANTNLTNVEDGIKANASGNVDVSGVDVSGASGKAVDVETESGNVEVTDIKLDDVGEGISAKSESGNVAVDDVVASDVKSGAAVDANANSVKVSNTNLTNVEDGIKANASGNVDVSGVDVSGASGKAVDVESESGDVSIEDTNLKDVNEGISAKSESGSVGVDNVVASDVKSGAAIDAAGDNVNIANTNLTNVDSGIVANATGGNVEISDVVADGVSNGAAVDASGKNVTVKDTNLSNVKDGVKASAEDTADVSGVDVTQGSGTAVDVKAETAKVEEVKLTNSTGTAVKADADNKSIGNVSAEGGNVDAGDATGMVEHNKTMDADKAFTIPTSNSKNPVFTIEMPGDATGYLVVKADGKEVARQALSGGKASATVNGLSAGAHSIEVSYTGDDKYAAISKTGSVTVPADPVVPAVVKKATKITAKSVKKTYKKNVLKKIKLTLKSGKSALKGKFKITLKVNKKLKGSVGNKLKKGKVFTVKFNKKGVGYIKLTKKQVNGFKKGTYKFTVTYKGSSLYKASKKTMSMKIK